MMTNYVNQNLFELVSIICCITRTTIIDWQTTDQTIQLGFTYEFSPFDVFNDKYKWLEFLTNSK